jgi:hypothetical protein
MNLHDQRETLWTPLNGKLESKEYERAELPSVWEVDYALTAKVQLFVG